MRIFAYDFSGVAGVVHEDFLRCDGDVDCVPVGFNIEGAVGRELQKIQTGQVAGGIVQEHVLAAGVAGIDARGIFGGVPAVDGGIVLHSGVAALPGGFGNLGHQVFGFVGGHYAAIHNGFGGKIGVAHYGNHEVVGDADGVVGVLEEDGAVGIGVGMRAVVSLQDQRVGFGFFFTLALDEVDYVGMVDVEDDHLGGTARLASGLDYAGEGVEAFHEAERTAGGASAA